jgi:hypothetical protein
MARVIVVRDHRAELVARESPALGADTGLAEDGAARGIARHHQSCDQHDRPDHEQRDTCHRHIDAALEHSGAR